MPKRYRDLNTYLREKFGCRVQKIAVDAGLSCPNRNGTVAAGGCLYCNARGSGSGAHSRGMTITDQLNHGIPILTRRYKASKFVAYFQSYSNTYAPAATLKALYDEALAFEEVVGLSIGTRPDCITRGVLIGPCSWGEVIRVRAISGIFRRLQRGPGFSQFLFQAGHGRLQGLYNLLFFATVPA